MLMRREVYALLTRYVENDRKAIEAWGNLSLEGQQRSCWHAPATLFIIIAKA